MEIIFIVTIAVLAYYGVFKMIGTLSNTGVKKTLVFDAKHDAINAKELSEINVTEGMATKAKENLDNLKKVNQILSQSDW